MTISPALITHHEPLEIHEEIPPGILGLNDVNSRAEKPVKVEVTVYRSEDEESDGDLIATGWATTTLSMLCGRCATWMPWPVRAQVEHVFEAPLPGEIDLTPLIREDILLELPLNAVCQLGADGKCPITGEFYKPRPESTATLVGQEVWAELSKLEPKPKSKLKSRPKK